MPNRRHSTKATPRREATRTLEVVEELFTRPPDTRGEIAARFQGCLHAVARGAIIDRMEQMKFADTAVMIALEALSVLGIDG